MELNDAKVLGALHVTRGTKPMTVSEIAKLAGVSTRITVASLHLLANLGLARQKYPNALPTWWEITDTGVTSANRRPNREHIKTGEEVKK